MRRVLAILTIVLAGCASGGGSSKSGGARETSPAAGRPVTLKFASSEISEPVSLFMSEVARRSGGRLRLESVRYDINAPDEDQRIAKDLRSGKLDVAFVASRAWESLGVNPFRALQAPFLITSRTLLDRVAADRPIVNALMSSLSAQGVTGLALEPVGVRYLFATRPLSTPAALEGARVRTNQSDMTTETLKLLGARAVETIPSGDSVTAALRARHVDAVEADPMVASGHGYQRLASHLDIGLALFAKANTIAANRQRLRALGPDAARWLTAAAAAAARKGRDNTADRRAWAGLCGGGLKVQQGPPAARDALRLKVEDIAANLDGDPNTAFITDRIGLLATQSPRIDAWAGCGHSDGTSATKVLDGTYDYAPTEDQLVKRGAAPGNGGRYRTSFGNGRYAIVLNTNHGDSVSKDWKIGRDPIEVGSVRVEGRRMWMIPDTSINVGSVPETYRFELFRGQLRLRFAGHGDPNYGTEDVNITTVPLRRAD
jgi:TRAP-type C4-dicarboxylate transport system substrate-binding protein